MRTNNTNNIVIRALTDYNELQAAEQIQRIAWDDPSTVVYRNLLINISRNGGLVLGAFDGDRLIGFLLGYLGTESPTSTRPAMANLKLVSQRMVVLPEYRDQGIGYELKIAQRNFAIQQGIRLVTWTYDPLGTRNAHLNIRKLGAIVREYWPDYYGTAPSPQVVLGTSDRFIAEWWVTGNRVEQRIMGKRGTLTLAQYTASVPILNPSRQGTEPYPRPAEAILTAEGMLVLLEIPEDYSGMVAADPELALAWRMHTRIIFQQLLGAGYTVTDFVRGLHEGRHRSFYALSVLESPMVTFSNN